MSAGTRKHRVTFLQPTAGLDAVGSPANTYAAAFTYWAEVRGAFAAERVSSNEEVAKADLVVKVLQSAETQTVDATWRLQVDASTYNILSITPYLDPVRGRSIEIRAEGRVDS